MTERMTATQVRALKAKAPPDPLEKAIRKQVTQYLKLMGWFVYYNLQGTGSYPGTNDVTVVKDGRVVFIEFKRRKTTQSDPQLKFQADIESHGGEYVVIRSLDEAMRIFPPQTHPLRKDSPCSLPY